jgi:pyruvate/2-oxoglutarate dehydrogenase complex dihydrolipoamide dehydrogenase (E3) component
MDPGDGRTYRDVEDIPGNIYLFPPIYKVGITYNVHNIKSLFGPGIYRIYGIYRSVV